VQVTLAPECLVVKVMSATASLPVSKGKGVDVMGVLGHELEQLISRFSAERSAVLLYEVDNIAE
jgi:hypothetical protein